MSGALASNESAASTERLECRVGRGVGWVFGLAIGIFVVVAAVGVLIGLGWWPVGYRMIPTGLPFLWPLFPLGFFLLVFLVFFALRWSRWGGGRGARGYWGYGEAGAREILRRRYARGQITRAQLEQTSRDLDDFR
jgi:uncharacterized membrane protein